MPTISACPSCDKKLKTPDDAEGKKIRCPTCKTMLVITEDGLDIYKNGVQTSSRKGSTGPVRSRRDDDEDGVYRNV